MRTILKPSFALALALFVLVVAALAAWMLSQAAEPKPFAIQTEQAGDLRVTLQIAGSDIGQQTIDLQVRDAADKPVALRALRLRLAMREMDMGTTELNATELSSGHYQARSVPFTMVGAWDVLTILMRDGQADAQARFTIPIAAPGEQAGPINPLANDPQAIVAGETLYRANCVTCHGASGRGDGPSAAGLKPRPADFAQHMVSGMHTDGQVFLWIQQGYPGSAMPAWDKRLNEQQMWQLVSYLRTFGQPVRAPIPSVPAVQAAPTTPVELLPTIPPAPTLAPIPTTDEQLPPIVFAREGNIWRSDGAGSVDALTHLTEEQYAQYPSYSPDGARIAYVVVSPPPITATNPLPTSALYIMDADGSDVEQVWRPPQGLLTLPSWSHDGAAIYLAVNGLEDQPNASAGDGLTVARFDLGTRTGQTVFKGALDPTVSRDGTRIAYLKLADDGYTMDLHVAALSGADDRVVLAGADFQGFYAPRFSPDGTTIYVAAIGGPEIEEPSQQAPSVTTTPAASVDGHISPVVRATPPRLGRTLVDKLLELFAPTTAEAHGLPWEMWTVQIDGTGLHQLTHVYADLPMVAFSPDGQQVVMMEYNGVYLMNPDGSNLRQISRRGDHGGLDWQP